MNTWIESRGRLRKLEGGFSIVLAGRTNAGKSTLVNALCQRHVSLVSPVHGTTRDIVKARVDLAGYPCTISDTAGLREESSDDI